MKNKKKISDDLSELNARVAALEKTIKELKTENGNEIQKPGGEELLLELLYGEKRGK